MLNPYQPPSFNTALQNQQFNTILQNQQLFEPDQIINNEWSKYLTIEPEQQFNTILQNQQQNNNGLYKYLIDNIHDITNFSYKNYFLTNIQNINIEDIDSYISRLLFLRDYDKIQKQLEAKYSDYKSYDNLRKSIIIEEEMASYNFKVLTNIKNLYTDTGKSKMPFIFYKICAKIYAEKKIIIIMSTILLFYILLGKFKKKYKKIIKNNNVFKSITKYFILLKNKFLNIKNKYCILLLIKIIKNIISGKYIGNSVSVIKKNIKKQITHIKNKYGINNLDFLTDNTRKINHGLQNVNTQLSTIYANWVSFLKKDKRKDYYNIAKLFVLEDTDAVNVANYAIDDENTDFLNVIKTSIKQIFQRENT